MSIETDYNQLRVYYKLYEDYNKLLNEKYSNRTFTVLKEPINNGFFKKDETYKIDRFVMVSYDVYVTSLFDGNSKAIHIKKIKINDLDEK